MIYIPKEVYRNFLQFALENANPEKRSRWRECIGLVLGRITGEKVFVTDIIPIGSGSSVFVDIRDYEKVFSLISFDRIDKGEVIVGWAHTHPGLGLFFSGTDIGTQLTYQSMHELSFGLVLDHTKIKSNSPGFNIYRVDSSNSRPYTVNYQFTDDFNFLSVYYQLAHELYDIAIPLVELMPELTAENVLTWKNITLTLEESANLEQEDSFTIKLVLRMSRSQYFRVTYKTKIYNAQSNFMPKSEDSQEYFHETFDSGTLAIFSFTFTGPYRAILHLVDIKITDYNQKYFNAPAMGIEITHRD